MHGLTRFWDTTDMDSLAEHRRRLARREEHRSARESEEMGQRANAGLITVAGSLLRRDAVLGCGFL